MNSTQSPPPPAAASPLLRLVFVVILGASALFAAAYLRYLLGGGAGLNDFFVFWSAARMARQGPLAAVYDPQLFQAFKQTYTSGHLLQLPFVYPPSSMLLFAPLGLLPETAAQLLWNLGSLALFLFAVRLVLKCRWAALAALVAPATIISLLLGQTGLLCGALALLGFGLLRQRPLAAGLALGLLALKPQLALLPIPLLLVTGRLRAAAVAAAVAAALCGASLALFGADAWNAWLGALHQFSGGLPTSAGHQQFGVTAYFSLIGLGLPSRAALAIQAAVSLWVLWSAARALDSASELVRIGVPLGGICLATPYAVGYDLPALSAACVMLFMAGRRGGFQAGEIFTLIAAWWLPYLVFFFSAQLYAAALGVQLLFLALLLRRRVPAPAA